MFSRRSVGDLWGGTAVPGAIGQREQPVPQLRVGQAGRVVGQGDDLPEHPARPPTFLDCRRELVEVGQAVAGGLATHRHVLPGRQYPLVRLGPAGPGSAVRGMDAQPHGPAGVFTFPIFAWG
jgi:hypothetical protein